MFYYKKNDKDTPNVDYSKEHSSMEIHVMRDKKPTKCEECETLFKDGEACVVAKGGGQSRVYHMECPKK